MVTLLSCWIPMEAFLLTCLFLLIMSYLSWKAWSFNIMMVMGFGILIVSWDGLCWWHADGLSYSTVRWDQALGYSTDAQLHQQSWCCVYSSDKQRILWRVSLFGSITFGTYCVSTSAISSSRGDDESSLPSASYTFSTVDCHGRTGWNSKATCTVTRLLPNLCLVFIWHCSQASLEDQVQR